LAERIDTILYEMNKSTGGGSNTNWKQRNGYSNNGNASDGPTPMDLGAVDKVQKLTPELREIWNLRRHHIFLV
jgi:hypothetical protein